MNEQVILGVILKRGVDRESGVQQAVVNLRLVYNETALTLLIRAARSVWGRALTIMRKVYG